MVPESPHGDIEVINGLEAGDELVGAMVMLARSRGLSLVHQTPFDFAARCRIELIDGRYSTFPQGPLFIRGYALEPDRETSDERFLRGEVNGTIRAMAYLSATTVINRPSEWGYAGFVLGNDILDILPIYGQTAFATQLLRVEHYCSRRPEGELELQDMNSMQTSYNFSDFAAVGPFRYRLGSELDDFVEIIVVGKRYWSRRPLVCYEHGLASHSIALLQSLALTFGVLSWRVSGTGVRAISMAKLHLWPDAQLLSPFLVEVADALIDELTLS
jgi:hypothetical protein